MKSPKHETYMKKDNENEEILTNIQEKKIDHQIFNQIELLIQQKYQIFVPSFLFEYTNTNTNREFIGWDYDDLLEFFSHFGEVELLEIYGKFAIILFRTFIDAYTAKEFLQTSSNFKETEKDKFKVRWYTQDDESVLSDLMRNKLKRYSTSQIVENVSNFTGNFGNNYTGSISLMNNFHNYNMYNNYGLNSNNTDLLTNFNTQYNYYSSMSLTPKSREEFNALMYSKDSTSSNFHNGLLVNNDEDNKALMSSDKYLLNGKYTCKFEIQIENDHEFQVARRLIGAKGCNMKKIVELCSRGRDGKFIPDAVKLRLRGKGSGYKEGPYNKESDEPLHLCISSKYNDRYKRASILVNELITNVYEEYKRFCERHGKIPSSNLTIQKEESVSSRRNGGLSNVNPVLEDYPN